MKMLKRKCWFTHPFIHLFILLYSLIGYCRFITFAHIGNILEYVSVQILGYAFSYIFQHFFFKFAETPLRFTFLFFSLLLM